MLSILLPINFFICCLYYKSTLLFELVENLGLCQAGEIGKILFTPGGRETLSLDKSDILLPFKSRVPVCFRFFLDARFLFSAPCACTELRFFGCFYCRFYCRFWLPFCRAESQRGMILPDQIGFS